MKQLPGLSGVGQRALCKGKGKEEGEKEESRQKASEGDFEIIPRRRVVEGKEWLAIVVVVVVLEVVVLGWGLRRDGWRLF